MKNASARRKKRKRGPLVFQLISKAPGPRLSRAFPEFPPSAVILAPLLFSHPDAWGPFAPLASGLPFSSFSPFSGLKAPRFGPGAQRVVILDVQVPLRKTPPDSRFSGWKSSTL